MVEYKDGDSEELRHKTVGRYIVTVDTAIDQLQRLTRSRLQAKTATHIKSTTMAWRPTQQMNYHLTMQWLYLMKQQVRC